MINVDDEVYKTPPMHQDDVIRSQGKGCAHPTQNFIIKSMWTNPAHPPSPQGLKTSLYHTLSSKQTRQM